MLLASTAIFAGTGYGWARYVVPTYRATSFVVVPPAAENAASVESVLSDLETGESLAAAAASLPPRVSTVLAGDDEADRSTDVERLARGLSLEAEAGAPIVAVSFRHRDPAVAEAVVNAVAASFVARTEPALTQSIQRPPPMSEPDPVEPERAALEAEVLARRADLAKAEADLVALGAPPTPAVAQAPGASAAAVERLEATRSARAQARRALGALEARQSAIARVRSGRPVDPGVLPADLRAAVSRRNAVRAEAEALAETYGDNHPRLRRGREDAAEAQAALGAALDRAERILSAELSRGRQALAELDARERREASSLSAASAPAPVPDPQAERRAALDTAVGEARSALDDALGRWEASRTASVPAAAPQVVAPEAPIAGDRPRLMFTEAARPEEPEERPILISTAGFGLAGFFGGLLPFLFRRRRADPKLWDDASALSDPIATDDVPTEEAEVAPPASTRAPSSASPRVEELAEAVVASRMTRLLVFGTSPEDGAEAAVALVRHLAERDGSAVLVDLTEESGAATLMGRPHPSPGLTDYVEGRCEIADLIHPDTASSAHFVSAGETFDVRLLQAAPSKLVTLMQALEASYGCVVLHLDEPGPRILGTLMHEDAALIVAAQLDDSLLVADLTDRLADAGAGDAIVLWLDPPVQA
ncbi:hypothetical protein [Antarcticirhabdus aurantiaca]|uniref:Uncharacterized protein n=1 Tax=Antarcticirhabdus aurantiaca TaxID=2606717 RepID=A0ACD4NHL4_9HYPH|nr:hypothetical protein [Antarcticirhabdus aurantiaca]WAJ26258.1 hypothetical protein OXU80_15230 [Jeongeuplla avenae]